jgi:hypothetical protein
MLSMNSVLQTACCPRCNGEARVPSRLSLGTKLCSRCRGVGWILVHWYRVDKSNGRTVPSARARNKAGGWPDHVSPVAKPEIPAERRDHMNLVRKQTIIPDLKSTAALLAISMGGLAGLALLLILEVS